MPRLLITGGSGYLGDELARQAPGRGWETAATYRSAPVVAPRVTPIALDIRDRAAVSETLASWRPDLVIHTAYIQDGPELRAVTVGGTEAVAGAAYAVGARLIHLSSDVIFDGERVGPYVDDDSPSPVSAYGGAKAEAEHAVRSAAPTALIVRTSLIYGGPARPPMSKHERLVLEAVDGRTDIAFFTDELRCPIAVDDLAAAILDLAEDGAGGTLNVAGPETVSRYTFACLVAAAYGRDPERVRGVPSPPGSRRPRNCALDSRRAQAQIRTRLRGVREVLGAHDCYTPRG